MNTDKPTKSVPVWLSVAVTAFAFSRLWILPFVYFGHASHPYLEKMEAGWVGVANWWLNPWTLFDSGIFLDIASRGYVPLTAGSFPLYPLLLRMAGTDPLAQAAWGIVLSNLAFLGGLCLLFRLTELDYNETVAKRAVWLLAFFPTTAVFSSVYNESLFLLLSLATFYAARRGRWLECACWGVLAGLTRNLGALLFIALLMEYFQQKKDGRMPGRYAWLASLAPLASFAGMQIYVAQKFGGAGSNLTGAFYGRAFCLPWQSIVREIDNFFRDGIDLVALLNLAAIFGVLLLLWRFRNRQRIGYSIFLGGVLFLHLIYGRVSPPFTNGALRFFSATFPFSQTLAVETVEADMPKFRRRILGVAYLAVCAVMCFLFGKKWFIPG